MDQLTVEELFDKHFGNLIDPRIVNDNKKHEFTDIIMLTILAIPLIFENA